ncbi:ABC transporter permease [Nonomuraea sp. NBC_01738]|uniref:ABC transporter permease n=1 Tax=Nonomuraea sp. NBC_01738 TaxID=2976003 RepID=UPI002E12708A|nr:ABC transporter permease [Nonomuraea sp. NBC_01738]
MMPYWPRKALSALLTLWLSSIVVFALLRLTPGDPAAAIAGPDATAEQVAAIRDQLLLDDPLPSQYLHWLGGLLTGDPGISYQYDRPITDLLAESVGSTVQLALAGILMLPVVGLLTGLALASRRFGKAADAFATAALSLPVYVSAVILVFLFAVQLRVLPAGGELSFLAAPDLSVQFLLLPGIALALPAGAVLGRLLATELRRTRQEEFVLTAVAKGVPPGRISRLHVLPGSLGPFVVEFGIGIGELLGGAVIAEELFARNGLGKLMLDSVQNRDYPMAQTLLMLAIAVAVLAQLGTEVVLTRLDPRIKLGVTA